MIRLVLAIQVPRAGTDAATEMTFDRRRADVYPEIVPSRTSRLAITEHRGSLTFYQLRRALLCPICSTPMANIKATGSDKIMIPMIAVNINAPAVTVMAVRTRIWIA